MNRDTLILTWDSQDPDCSPRLYVPPELKHMKLRVLDRSEENGGRADNTDLHDIKLLEAGAHAGYPEHSELH